MESVTWSRSSYSSGSSELEPAEQIRYYAGMPYRQRCSPSEQPLPPSEPEVIFYYAGLPSRPHLVARSRTTIWELMYRLAPFPVHKEHRPVYEHPIQEFWEYGLAAEAHQLLDSMEVDWTSTDVVRIDIDERSGESTFPVILWIGVTPDCLPSHRGINGKFFKSTTFPTSTSRSGSLSLFALPDLSSFCLPPSSILSLIYAIL